MKAVSRILLAVLGGACAGGLMGLALPPQVLAAKMVGVGLHAAGFASGRVEYVSFDDGALVLWGLQLDRTSRISTISVPLSLSGLAHLRLDAVRVAGAHLEMAVDEKGRMTWPGIAPKRAGGRFVFPFLPVASVAASDIDVVVSTPAGPVRGLFTVTGSPSAKRLDVVGNGVLRHEEALAGFSFSGGIRRDGMAELNIEGHGTLAHRLAVLPRMEFSAGFEKNMAGPGWQGHASVDGNAGMVAGQSVENVHIEGKAGELSHVLSGSLHLPRLGLGVSGNLDVSPRFDDVGFSVETDGKLNGLLSGRMHGKWTDKVFGGNVSGSVGLPVGNVQATAENVELDLAGLRVLAKNVRVAAPDIRGMAFRDIETTLSAGLDGAQGAFSLRGLPPLWELDVPLDGQWQTDWKTVSVSASAAATRFSKGRTPAFNAQVVASLAGKVEKARIEAEGGSLVLAKGVEAGGVTAKASWTDGRLAAEIAKVQIRVPALGRISVSGNVSASDLSRIGFSGKAETLDTSAFATAFSGQADGRDMSVRGEASGLGLQIGALAAENGSARIRYDGKFVALEDVSATAYGGDVRVVDMKIEPTPLRVSGKVVASSLELASFFEHLGSKGLSGAGKVDATLPFSFGNGKLSVADGHISGQGNGVIRYVRQVPDHDSRMQLTWKILENLHYAKLEGDVSGTLGGEQSLRLRVEGNNPEVYDGRAVEWNLDLSGALDSLVSQGKAAAGMMRGKVEE